MMKFHVEVLALLVTFVVSGALPAADVTAPVADTTPTVQVSGAFGSLADY
jgi:hypothetical protein